MMQKIELDYFSLRKSVLTLRAVNHKIRQIIIDLLDEYEEMTVTEVYIKLRCEQSVASQHLAILSRSGVVVTERRGKFIIYSLNYETLDKINRLVNNLVK